MPTVSMTYRQSLRQSCSIGGVEVRFPKQSAQLLELFLLRAPDHYVHPEDIIEWLWPNPDEMPDDPATLISVQVRRLRSYGILIERVYSPLAVYASRPRYGGLRIPAEARASVHRRSTPTGCTCRWSQQGIEPHVISPVTRERVYAGYHPAP